MNAKSQRKQDLRPLIIHFPNPSFSSPTSDLPVRRSRLVRRSGCEGWIGEGLRPLILVLRSLWHKHLSRAQFSVYCVSRCLPPALLVPFPRGSTVCGQPSGFFFLRKARRVEALAAFVPP